ncbi:hypothetical protein C5E04_18945 [Pectobacterium parmentieri]|nr:hypothetical protein C5E04_18945 [Pectobacterium parmentieri]
MTDDERVAIIDRLLAVEVEVTNLRREHETMHSIEYVQGLVSKIAELEAQLAELRGQEPVVRVSEESFSSDGTSDILTINLPIGMELFSRPVPPAASQPIIVTDDMAMAFHRATTDGDVGSDDVSDIKTGLNAALCNISVQPYTVPDERAAYETFIAKRLGDSIDTQRARNGDPEKPDYMAWDMTVGWIAWQGRAGMLKHHSGDAADKVNSPELPDGWALVPIEPTIDMCGAGAVVPQHKGE